MNGYEAAFLIVAMLVLLEIYKVKHCRRGK